MPGFKNFVDLTPLPESDLDDYLAKQVVMKFATAAARDAALVGVLRSGMLCWLDNTGVYEYYTGALWQDLALHPSFVSRYVAVPTAWTAVTFANSWVNYGTPYQNVQYRKVGDVVELRGMAKSGVIGSNIFVLPAGFRPPVDVFVSTVSNAAAGALVINFAGGVLAPFGTNAYVSMHARFSTVA